MSDTCAVVTVIRDGVEVRINATDFDPKVDKLAFDEPNTGEPSVKSREEMTATELREYAKEHGIDVKGLKSREDLLKAVTADKSEFFVFPNAEGKFTIVNAEGTLVMDEVFDTQEEAEKAIG